MVDPATHLSSPTISSVSSSDLDTESTGSFFHDRSTTLGTLMGVSFAAIAFRAPSQRRELNNASSVAAVSGRNKKKKRIAAPVPLSARRRWWRLCGDGDVKPASLGEFLEVERRFGDAAFYGTAAELEGVIGGENQERNGRRVLFADGRVLPPSDHEETSSTAEVLCGFPVSITDDLICARFSLEDLICAWFPLEDLICAQFPPEDLICARFPPEDLICARFLSEDLICALTGVH